MTARPRSTEERVFAVLRWASIAFFVTISTFPVIAMISMSFRPMSALLRDPGQLLPSLGELSAEAYVRTLKARGEGGFGFGQFIGNSALIASVTALSVLLVGCFAAYAATRMRYRGAGAINAGFLMVYLFPPLIFAVPLFVVFSRLGMRPSFSALILIYVAQTLPLALYMLRNYFRTIPLEIEEAAHVDGASRRQVIRHVVVPLATPAIVTVGVYVFMTAWDEFLFALLFLVEDRGYWTAALGINQLENNVGTPTTVLMAACVVITIPLVVLFAVAQKLLTEGLTSGGVRE